MLCDLRFFMSAMKPTPQESFSLRGIVEALRGRERRIARGGRARAAGGRPRVRSPGSASKRRSSRPRFRSLPTFLRRSRGGRGSQIRAPAALELALRGCGCSRRRARTPRASRGCAQPRSARPARVSRATLIGSRFVVTRRNIRNPQGAAARHVSPQMGQQHCPNWSDVARTWAADARGLERSERRNSFSAACAQESRCLAGPGESLAPLRSASLTGPGRWCGAARKEPCMNFASDNIVGASRPVLDALVRGQ